MRWRALPVALLWALALAAPAEGFRAAVYETWNATAWSGKTPRYTPTLGLYSSSDPTVVSAQLDKMAWGKIDVGIVTDWDRRNRADSQVGGLLSTTTNAGDRVKWTLYYAGEGNSDPPPEQIGAVLDYVQGMYAWQSSYLKVNGKPVLFVRTGATDTCATADRWAQASTRFYVSLKIFANYRTCASQPDSWHQYTPNKRADFQRGFSYSISPGYWGYAEATPRLERAAVPEWEQTVASMVASREPWQIVTTFNSWDEGTSVEPAIEWTPAGCGDRTYAINGCPGKYLNVLRRDGQPLPPPGDPRIAAAGDIVCESATPGSSSCRQAATSDLLVSAAYRAVLPLGDLQYERGVLSSFQSFYEPTWGRVKSITAPAVGNHEYQTTGASGYFDYFNGVGNQTGPAGDRSTGYYSYDIGAWHLIALNSNCGRIAGGCGAGSPQEQWLRADLAAHPNKCTLAYWHHPRFTAGNYSNNAEFQAFWQALYDHKAEVVLNGHDHNYQRYALQDPLGNADPAGLREFVVGTGGKNHASTDPPPIPNREVADHSAYGVLELTLHASSYDWRFIPEPGKTFTDTGSGTCS